MHFNHVSQAYDWQRQRTKAFLERSASLLGRLNQPVFLVNACPPSAGKSSITTEQLMEIIAAKRAQGRRFRVLFTVPTHKLGNQTAAFLQQSGLTVAVFYGRSEANCQQHGAIREAHEVGCRPGSVCGKCPFREACEESGYYSQHDNLAKADIVIASHHFLFHQLPRAADTFNLTVIDEGPWLATGILDSYDFIRDDVLDGPRLWPVRNRGKFDDVDTAELISLRSRLLHAIDNDIPVTAPECERAMQLEERRRISNPDAAGCANGMIDAYLALWRACASAPGRIERCPDGRIKLHHRKALRPEIPAGPLLYLDGTAVPEIAELFLPGAEHMACEIAAPHERVHLVKGCIGKTTLENNAERVRRIATRAIAIADGQPALLVTYKPVEPMIARLVPPNFQTVHFGNLRGLNDFAHVRHLFVVGRWTPDDWALLRLAQQLFGVPMQPERMGWRDCTLSLTDGSTPTVRARGYQNPLLQTVFSAIADSETIQALARARGLTRTTENPVDIHIMADALPAGVKAYRVRRFDDTPADTMAAEGLIVFRADHARSVYGDMLPPLRTMERWAETVKHFVTKLQQDLRTKAAENSERTLLKDYSLETSATIHKSSLDFGGSSYDDGWIPFEYQLAKRGSGLALACYNPSICPDPVAVLSKALGPIRTNTAPTAGLWQAVTLAVPGLPHAVDPMGGGGMGLPLP